MRGPHPAASYTLVNVANKMSGHHFLDVQISSRIYCRLSAKQKEMYFGGETLVRRYEVQRFALSILSFFPCGFCMFSLRLLEFSPGTPASAHGP